MNEISHENPLQHININPKSKSIKVNSQKWKEDLRNECLQRAKASRKEVLLRRRRLDRNSSLYSDAPASIGFKVRRDIMEHYDLGQVQEDQARLNEIKSDHPLDKDDLVRIKAKSLVEQVVRSSRIHHFNDEKNLLADRPSSVEDMEYGDSDAKLISWSEDTSEESKGQSYVELLRREDAKWDEERKMTEMDYSELLNDVAQELQEEDVDEMWEEELWELERLEAMNREHMMHKTGDFEDW